MPRVLQLDALEPRRDPDTGAFVFVQDPGTERVAIAREAVTTILAIGAARGRIFTPSPWETNLLPAN